MQHHISTTNFKRISSSALIYFFSLTKAKPSTSAKDHISVSLLGTPPCHLTTILQDLWCPSFHYFIFCWYNMAQLSLLLNRRAHVEQNNPEIYLCSMYPFNTNEDIILLIFCISPQYFLKSSLHLHIIIYTPLYTHCLYPGLCPSS